MADEQLRVWLDRALLAYTALAVEGATATRRRTINFSDAFKLTDDEANNRTDVEIDPAGTVAAGGYKLTRAAEPQPDGYIAINGVTFNGTLDQVIAIGHNAGVPNRADTSKLGFWLQLELDFEPTEGADHLSEFFVTWISADGNTILRPMGCTVNHTTELADPGMSGRCVFTAEDNEDVNMRIERNGDIVSARTDSKGFVAEGTNRNILSADKSGAGGYQVILKSLNDTKLQFVNAFAELSFDLATDFLVRPKMSAGVNVPANQYIFAGSTQLLGVDNFAEVIVGSSANLMILTASNGGGHGIFFDIGGINATARNEGWSIGNGSTGVGAGLLLDLVSTTRALGIPSGTNAQMTAITPARPAAFIDTTNNKLNVYVGGAWVAVH